MVKISALIQLQRRGYDWENGYGTPSDGQDTNRDGGKNNTYTSALVVDGNRVDESDAEVKRWLKNITITHDLNLIVNADYMLDLGPRGGKNVVQLVAEGRPLDLIKKPDNLTVKYLADYLEDE